MITGPVEAIKTIIADARLKERAKYHYDKLHKALQYLCLNLRWSDYELG